jgi:hypothetical protein
MQSILPRPGLMLAEPPRLRQIALQRAFYRYPAVSLEGVTKNITLGKCLTFAVV